MFFFFLIYSLLACVIIVFSYRCNYSPPLCFLEVWMCGLFSSHCKLEHSVLDMLPMLWVINTVHFFILKWMTKPEKTLHSSKISKQTRDCFIELVNQWERVRDRQRDNIAHRRADCLRSVPEMAFSVPVRVRFIYKHGEPPWKGTPKYRAI